VVKTQPAHAGDGVVEVSFGADGKHRRRHHVGGGGIDM
jgi:hypothetical protein